MLIKKKLLEIPVMKPDRIKQKYDYNAVAQTVDGILSVDFHKKSGKECFCRFFTDGKNYIFYRPKSDEWVKRTLNGALQTNYVYSFGSSEESDKTARKFFDTYDERNHYDKNLSDLINSFISNIQSERTEKARDARLNRINMAMNLFPKNPPDGFYKWFINKFYNAEIFDKRKRLRTFKEKQRVVICYRADDKILFEWATVKLSATREDKKPAIWLDVYHRIVREDGKDKHFDYKNVMYWGYAWREYKYDYDDWAYVYPGNLHDVFGGQYRNINLKQEMTNLIQPIKFIALLHNLKTYPQAEYFVKMGLTRLVSDLSGDELKKGKGFAGVLGVNKQYLPLYRDLQLCRYEHKLIKNTNNVVDETQFKKMRDLKFKNEDIETIGELLQTMSFERFVNYFTKQKALLKVSLNKLMIYYRDYISMATDLEIDLSRKSVRFPKNIKESHDRIMAMFKEVENEIEDMKFKAVMDTLYNRVSEFKDKNYIIVLPQGKSDFCREGESLSHCVGSGSTYYTEHCKAKKMIFFVRKITDIETPFATLQINMERMSIIQFYGYGNKVVTGEPRKFADKFLKQLTKTYKENYDENKSKRNRKKTQTA